MSAGYPTTTNGMSFLSGLLLPTIGGPSVALYQPLGLWDEVSINTPSVYTGHRRQTLSPQHGQQQIIPPNRGSVPCYRLMNLNLYENLMRIRATNTGIDAFNRI